MKMVKILVAVILCLTEVVNGKTLLQNLNDQAFAVVGQRSVLSRQSRSTESLITGMHVTSVIRSRFAKVTTVSEMTNDLDEAKEITFSARLPDAAFIAEFSMIVDGVTFVGKVKEKALAKEEYEAAQKKGNPTGLVTANVRETQTFNVAANVPAHSSVTFTLVYQELLKRRLQKYEQQIFINPGQLVDDFTVTVYITERSGITMLATKHPEDKLNDGKSVASGFDLNGEVPIETEVRRSKYQAKVVFTPTQSEQRRLLMIPENDRKISVVYDVTREELGGELQTRDGYFVHFFAPEDLPILPKKVVFVIDRSGSMSGRKMQQTKEAFATVLRDMSEVDEFNIVTFASDVSIWKPDQMVPVTSDNVEQAIQYVQAIVASGSTNLNGGALKAARLLRDVQRHDKVSAAVIILTDGEPTAGITDESQIRLNVKRAVRGRFSVFCLGFGDYLNHDFLKKLANENDGIARKIFEDSDADLQLEGFFQEVATPLLLNVRVAYRGVNVSDVSETRFDKYFGGSEIMVTGVVDNEFDGSFRSVIRGVSSEGHVRYNVISKVVDESFRHWYDDAGDFSDFIERMWAYNTIKGLMEKKTLADSDEEIRSTVDRAMRLSMKYGFVTPLTSMVVVLPEDEKTTTPSSSTVHPPIPPCFFRGDDIPEYIIEPPILCPYVVDDADIQRAESSRNSNRRGGSRHSMHMRISSALARSGGSPYRAMSMQLPPPALSRHRQGNVRLSSRFLQIPSRSGYTYYNYAHSRYSEPSEPEVAENCGGNLTSESGRITSPGDLGHEDTVYCDWTVELPEGSWIDLFIEKLSTENNAVKITGKNDEVLLDHSRGDTPAKKMYLTDNKIKIRMTVAVGEQAGGIVISYAQFSPSSLEEITEDLPVPTNCGNRTASTESPMGFISSPNYPSEYPSNANCVWTIANEAPDVSRLQITLLDIDIEMNELGECVHDKFTINSGSDVKTRCGFTAGESFIFDEEVVTLSFSSDDKLESSGFRVKYEFVSNVSK